MRPLTAALLLTLSLSCSFAYGETSSAAAGTPLEIVNLRMKLYNEHRADAMLELYSDDVAIYTYPDQLLGKGKEHMQRVLTEIFNDPSVRVAIPLQIEKDSYVINRELVTYAGKPTEYVSIYEVRAGLIRSVRFVRN